MTNAELDRIESALGIAFPQTYRERMNPFPIPAYAGNAETELWDDADKLIELNRELRGGTPSVRPWPQHMFALGCDQGGCANALDLLHPDCQVWWADRCHLDLALRGDSIPEPFAEWFTRTVDDRRSDLEGDGIDPDSSPEARLEAEAAAARAGGRCFVIVVAIGALIVLVGWGIVFTLNR